MNFLERLNVLFTGKGFEQKAIQPYRVGTPFVRYPVEINNGRLVTPQDNKIAYVRDGYSINDIIYSVCSMILDKVRLPAWKLYTVTDDNKRLKADGIMRRKNLSGKDHKQALKLYSESLQEITNFNLQTGKLDDLLKYPNDLSEFSEFVTYASLFKLITGDAYIWGDLLNDGANNGIPNSLWVLPSQYINIKVSEGFPSVPLAYQMFLYGTTIFPKEQVLHTKYPNPNWSANAEQHYGFSPLRAFQKNTDRNNSAKTASKSKFDNGGLDEIIYMDDQRYDAEQGLQQASALKLKLAQEYSGAGNQGKVAVSGIKVGTAQLGLSPVDLGIIDSEKWDAIMFCNGFGVPPELLGLVSKTFNNIKEAEKALTTRSALPLLVSIRNSLNRKLTTDWGFKGQNIYIDFDTSCFSELQTDLAQVSTWMQTILMMSPDEQREMFEMDALNIPESKEVWVKTNSGYVPLSDFQVNQVDAQLNAEAVRQNIQNGATTNDGTGATSAQNGNGKVPPNGARNAGLPDRNGKALSFTKSL